MGKKRNRKELELIVNDIDARNNGANRRKFHIKDLKYIQPITENQRRTFESYNSNFNLFLHGSAGTGKAQPLHSKILTPTGWKSMGDIVIGDVILTPHGKESMVIGTFPQGMKDIYTIYFSDGSKAESCKEHLWECNVPQNLWNSNGKSSKKILSTEEIIYWLEQKKNKKSAKSNISIDLVEPIERKKQDLPIDPYFLGVMIGDGCLTFSSPLLSTGDENIILKIKNVLSEDYIMIKCNKKYDYKIIQETKKRGKNGYLLENNYTTIFKILGLHGKKSYEKFIPDMFKIGSIEQRLELIRGLLDTDGTVDKRGSISLCTTSYQLAKDVQEIIWSIGGKASIKEKQTTYRYNSIKKYGRKAYNISISYKKPKDLFSLDRKIERCKEEYQPKQLRRQIIDIRLTSHQEAKCIMIDDPSHLYVTDDYIITHNTFLSMYLALRDILDENTPYRKLIIMRSCVPVRDIGFLPGTEEEKIEIYEQPYIDICDSLFEYSNSYKNLKHAKKIEFMSTSFLRGLTFDNAIILVDELQNLTMEEADSIITRVGENTKIVFCGDSAQTDLGKTKRDQSGMGRFQNIISIMSDFAMIKFGLNDIVRSNLVRNYLICKSKILS